MSCLVSPEMIITGRVIDAEEALHIGYLQLGPISMQELEAMHVAHPPRKVGAPATFLALRMLGQPRPQVRGYRTLACLRRAGPRLLWQQFRGTVRRVLQGDNRESTI